MFKFSTATQDIVQKTIDKLGSTSSPVVTKIPTKIIKCSQIQFIKSVTQLINDCITTNEIPVDWKTAVVTPQANQLILQLQTKSV